MRIYCIDFIIAKIINVDIKLNLREKTKNDVAVIMNSYFSYPSSTTEI
jgi:hypothetical protein